MRTVLGGQYDQPDGIFYGGTGPAWSNELIRRIIRENCGGAERVLFLDLHTGLGPCVLCCAVLCCAVLCCAVPQT
jgi:hypothetical protein